MRQHQHAVDAEVYWAAARRAAARDLEYAAVDTNRAVHGAYRPGPLTIISALA
jgi:hypothetical protein